MRSPRVVIATSPADPLARHTNIVHPSIKQHEKEDEKHSDTEISKLELLDQRQKRKELANDLKLNLKQPYQLLKQDDDYLQMRQGIHPEFYSLWSSAFQSYLKGDWPMAILGFKRILVDINFT